MSAVINTTKKSRERDYAVQLNTRVSIDTRELIDGVVDNTENNIREVVELAVTSVWGKESGEVADMIRDAARQENLEYADVVERALREYVGKHRLRAVGE